MGDFDQKLHRLLSGLRDRGEFVGEVGETLLFTPPIDSITPKKVLLIGVGNEADITRKTLELVGEIAAREAVRLRASQVSFAPALRDQWSDRVDVGDGDAAFATGWILACDTENKLQDQGLALSFAVSSLTIEAGPKYFRVGILKSCRSGAEGGSRSRPVRRSLHEQVSSPRLRIVNGISSAKNRVVADAPAASASRRRAEASRHLARARCCSRLPARQFR
jgi:hypothetical protein